MIRMETIKKNYDECKLSYEAAMDLLEALGMRASQADDYLAMPSQERT